MAKRLSKRQEYEKHIKELSESFERWKFIRDNGGSDPFWPDGTNMNLVRNHILYNKRQILDICLKEGFEIPKEYYMPTPPKVDDNFMSNLKQENRVQRLIQSGHRLKTSKPKYDEMQLSLF